MVPMLTCGLVRSNFAFATGPSWNLLATPYDASGWTGVRGEELLAPGLLDDLFRHVLRNLGVGVELHRVRRPALRLGTQVADVPEHLRQRHQGLDDPAAAGALVHRLDVATARVEVADHLTHVVLGRDDLDGEHRLEQHRAGLAGGILEGHRTGDLERELGGVDVVVGAVLQRHLDVHHRVAGEHAELHRLLAALVHGRDVLPRDAATGDGVDELVAALAAGLRTGRLDVDDHATELTRTTGLLLVRVVDLLDLPGDGLAVGHLRLADVRLDPELALHPVDQHLEVQLAHAGDDGLAGVLVGPDLEGRVLLGEPLDRDAQLLLVALRLRLDRDRDHRGRELHRLQHDRVLLVAQRLAGGGVLQTHHRDDVAGADGGDLLTLVRVHPVDLADPLLLPLGGVQDLRAGLQLARVDTQEGQLAQVRVGRDLERERGERLGVARLPLDDLVRVLHGVTVDGRHVDRARQVRGDGVEQGLHALVLERRTGQHRGELARQGGAADAGDQLLLGRRLALEVELHDLVVGLGQRLDQLVVPLGRDLGVRRRDLLDGVVLTHLGLTAPGQRAHRDQVDDADEVGLGTDRELQHQRYGGQPGADHVDAAHELRAGPVQLVDEADPRNAVPVGLPPDGLRLRLDTGDTVEHRDRAVEDAQRALHLDREVDVPRGVDDVDRVALPRAGRRGGRDRDAALLLLLHPVHRRGAVVDLADLVADPRVEQDPLGRRGLAGVDVSHDPDVADLAQVGGDVYGHLGGLPLDSAVVSGCSIRDDGSDHQR